MTLHDITLPYFCIYPHVSTVDRMYTMQTETLVRAIAVFQFVHSQTQNELYNRHQILRSLTSESKQTLGHLNREFSETRTSMTPEGRSATFRVQGLIFFSFFIFIFYFCDVACCTISCNFFFMSRLGRVPLGGLLFLLLFVL